MTSFERLTPTKFYGFYVVIGVAALGAVALVVWLLVTL
jgi:hypothetical protein